MSRWGCLVVFLIACGDDSSVVDAAFDPDASTFDAAIDSAIDAAIDAPGLDSGGSDAAVDAALDSSGFDAGEEGCGSGEIVSGWDVPRTCLEAECMDHPTCEATDLARAGYADHEPCGSMDITPSSSAEACMMVPPFGPFPESPPYECGSVQYEGYVHFFCNADRTSVAARFVATHTAESGLREYFGHEYWAGSGGGSGDGRMYSALIDINTSRFFG